MNNLQHIPEDKFGPVLVTLNPPFEPDPDQVVKRIKYDHPLLGIAVRECSTQAIRSPIHEY